MRITPVYRDVLRSLEAAARGSPLWPAFHHLAYRPHREYFDGFAETYGPALLGREGLPALVTRLAPALHLALSPAPGYRMEERVRSIMARLRPLLPGRLPDVYLATLFFVAPAATISVGGRPAIALGLERFSPAPPPGPRYWYRPDEVEEMLPHEAAHAVRMEALGLPPSPQGLSLLDMVMLEGTALLFTDLLLGRETLATFMDPARLSWHRAHDAAVLAAAAREFGTGGMAAFTRYFAVDAPISGYWVVYSLCRRFLERYGTSAMRELLCMPSAEILRRLG